jgi:shikimate kinase
MRNEIILIGPMLAGKTTTAHIISKYSKIPVVHVDQIKWFYFEKYGLSKAHSEELLKTNGLQSMIDFYKSYEALVIENILHDHTNCIFDFGAGFTVYEDLKLNNKINSILNEYKNIFLILPTSNENNNMRILNYRLKNRIKNDPFILDHFKQLYTMNKYFLKHENNRSLANFVIFTDNVNEKDIIKQFNQKNSF